MKELKTAGVRLPDSPLVPYPSRSLVPERDVRYTPVLEASRLGIDFGGLTAVDDFTLTIGRTEIAGLIGRIRKEQKNLHIAEMKLLQAQINPHFLYNTLDSIVWMAEDGDNQKVVEMTADLSDFFRTVLSEGRDFITINEEKRHIESYLKIQKIRYEEILDYRISIDERIGQKQILKMILQPVVENALYHGIKNKRGGGMITIRGYEDKSGLVFEVEDNGRGMDTGTLKRLREKVSGSDAAQEVSEKGGFGMSNVAQRIRMYYGGDAAITIESEEYVGTCVKIYIGHGCPGGRTE